MTSYSSHGEIGAKSGGWGRVTCLWVTHSSLNGVDFGNQMFRKGEIRLDQVDNHFGYPDMGAEDSSKPGLE